MQSWKKISDAAPLRECHVNRTWHNLFFILIISAVTFISQLQCNYANRNPMTHWECCWRQWEAGGGGTSICTRPNEIDVPPSISVGTAGEEAQHAGTQHITHNLMSWGLVKNVPLSVKANSISYCPYLSMLILLSFLTHAHIHRLIQSICCSPHVHILQAPQREFAMKSLPGKCQVHLRTDLSLQWREMVVCGETEAK